ncbi:MAG: MBL fold metallo-hydrolase [Magnetococcales bacterium]|nr:MBL fold metallo-hydrolase [Magnetococcales bacterium]
MRLTVLGSGTGIPSARRNAPGYLLETGGGQTVLLDCGSGTLRQMERFGHSFATLAGVCITHQHPDHIGDLVSLLHACRLPGLQRREPLPIYGPAGFGRFYEQFILPVSGLPSQFEVRMQETHQPFELGGMQVRFAPTVHSERFASQGYRFEADGRVVVCSGDCDWGEAILELAKGADLLVLDCSTLQANKAPGHLSALQCGLLAQQAGVARVLLSHFYPIEGPDELRRTECAVSYSGECLLAEDGMVVAL